MSSNNYADAVDSRCTAIGVNGKYNPERDNPDPTDERCRKYRQDPIPSDWSVSEDGTPIPPTE